jgi:hypothetical protein
MSLTLRAPNVKPALYTLIANWRSAVVLVLLLFVAIVVARSFFGDSSSPYGTCYGDRRAVPCAALKH